MSMFAAIGGFMAFIIIALIILFILSTSVRIVPQAKALVVERLGAYRGTYGVGIHFLVPFIDRVARRVDLREQVEDFPPQPVITKDNVTMQIDTVVYLKGRVPRLNNGSGVGECPAIVSGYEYKPPLLVLYGR